jgi:hypothetical protein
MTTPAEPKVRNVHEKSRTYYYDYGNPTTLKNITEVMTKPGGDPNHYVKADGKLEIVRGGWTRISIDSVSGEWEA